jgi:hypothetical protein
VSQTTVSQLPLFPLLKSYKVLRVTRNVRKRGKKTTKEPIIIADSDLTTGSLTVRVMSVSWLTSVGQIPTDRPRTVCGPTDRSDGFEPPGTINSPVTASSTDFAFSFIIIIFPSSYSRLPSFKHPYPFTTVIVQYLFA